MNRLSTTYRFTSTFTMRIINLSYIFIWINFSSISLFIFNYLRSSSSRLTFITTSRITMIIFSFWRWLISLIFPFSSFFIWNWTWMWSRIRITSSSLLSIFFLTWILFHSYLLRLLISTSFIFFINSFISMRINF
jgi:hypothetical protein